MNAAASAWRASTASCCSTSPPASRSNARACRPRGGCIGPRKAGHTGTLDPLATGLLPLCFGEATKFSQRAPRRGQGLRSRRSRWASRPRPAIPKGEVVERRPVTVDARRSASACCAAFAGADRAGAADVLGAQARRPAALRVRARGQSVERAPRADHDPRAPARRARRAASLTVTRRAAARAPTCACSRRTSGAMLGCGAHLARAPAHAVGPFSPCRGGRRSRRSRR